jgi:SNF2 family DNA or RNA helicase
MVVSLDEGTVAKNIDTSVAKKKDFCRSWYRLMKSGDTLWDSLNQLLKKEMGRS